MHYVIQMRRKGNEITMNTIWTQTSTMDILIYLLEKKKVILSDFIYDMRKNPNTINRAVELLRNAELIKESMGNYNSRLFTITEKGIKIAELAKKQKEILETSS